MIGRRRDKVVQAMGKRGTSRYMNDYVAMFGFENVSEARQVVCPDLAEVLRSDRFVRRNHVEQQCIGSDCAISIGDVQMLRESKRLAEPLDGGGRVAVTQTQCIIRIKGGVFPATI